MKKTITKKIITVILSAMFAVCCFGVITTSTKIAKANTDTDIDSVTVAVEQAAEMKSSGNMGIKFNVDISKADYEGLKSSYDSVICGFIIAPKDYVEDVNAMDVDGWTIDEGATNVIEYQGGEPVEGTKYFQTDTVNPLLNLENSIYEFSGSFTKIDASNYDREFIVRAYVAAKNTGDADYSYKYSGTYSRSVYSVATSALAASGELGAEVLTFVKSVTGSVNTANTNAGRNYTFTVKNLTDGKEETDELKHGDTFSISASYTNGLGDTIIVIPTIENNTNTNITDNSNGTYTVNNPTGAEFTFKAVIEGTGKNIEKDITVNRQDVVRTLDQTAFTINDKNTEDGKETTMTVASEGIPAGAEGKTVYEVAYTYNDAQNGAHIVDSICLNKKNINAGEYYTFKYYNSGVYLTFLEDNVLVHGDNALGNTGVYQSASDAWAYGVIRHYDENGGLIIGGVDGSGIAATVGQWCTVEMYFENRVPGSKIDISLNGWRAVPEKVYMTDFTVSNYSLVGVYSDLQMTVTGGTGTDGAFNPGDEVKITSASVAVKGQTNRLDLDVTKLPLTFTEGAVEKVDGKYIYQGTGNFTVAANYYKASATSNETGIEGLVYQDLTSSFVTKSGNATVTKAEIPEGDTTSELYKAVSSKPIPNSDVYDYTASAGYANNIKLGTSDAIKDKYLRFSFYNNFDYSVGVANTGLTYAKEGIALGYLGQTINQKTYENPYSLSSTDYRGTFTIKAYNQNGQLVEKISTSTNEWITIEIYTTRLNGDYLCYLYFAGSQGRTVYLTGVGIFDTPLYPEA